MSGVNTERARRMHGEGTEQRPGKHLHKECSKDDDGARDRGTMEEVEGPRKITSEKPTQERMFRCHWLHVLEGLKRAKPARGPRA